MQTEIEKKSCALCGLAIRDSIVQENGQVFCCPGCRAVFTILNAKAQIGDWKAHPLFQKALHAGLISNPELLEQIEVQPELPAREWERYTLEISNMWCMSCAEVIRWVLLKEKGIRKCIVDYSTDLMALEFSPRHISKAKIQSILKGIGYETVNLNNPIDSKRSEDLYIRFGIAAFFFLNIMMFSYPIYASYFDTDDQGWGMWFAWLSCYASLPVIFYSGWPIFRRFWIGLRVQIFGMETLVTMGVGTAFGLSLYELGQGSSLVYFDSLTAIICFVLLGKIIENKAKVTAKQSLVNLIKSLPKRARKKNKEGEFKFVPIRDIQVGDYIQVLTGEKVNLDGIIIEGEVACDESVLTGEPQAIKKQAGDFLIAGSLIQQGHCVVQTTATLEQTALHQIIESVQTDVQHKGSSTSAVDQVLKWFIPFVLSFATLTAFLTADSSEAWLRFISILLISCPCAIGIAAPLAESYLIQGLAQMGVVVKNRGCLKFLGKETLYVFDKTGTVTQGKFKVLQGLEHVSPLQKTILKGLTSQSNHPISVAISQEIEGTPAVLTEVREYAGKGIEGIFEGNQYRVGSRQFLEEMNMHIPETPVDFPHSLAFFGDQNDLIAQVALGDSLKENIPQVIQSLHPLKTLLLSGDTPQAVAKVAQACGFTEYLAGVSPIEKKQQLATLRQKGEIVAMIGDGINDAPALANAHIGLSVANATDISMQASDALLLSEDLSVLSKMRALASKGRVVLHQNLFWAFFYNIVGMFLAAFGYLNPIFAAFAMTASSLIVLFNAKRLEIR